MDIPVLWIFSANINYLGMPQAVKASSDAWSRGICSLPAGCTQTIKTRCWQNVSHIEEEQILCGNGAAELIYCLVESITALRGRWVMGAPLFQNMKKHWIAVVVRYWRYLLQRKRTPFVRMKALSDRYSRL